MKFNPRKEEPEIKRTYWDCSNEDWKLEIKRKDENGLVPIFTKGIHNDSYRWTMKEWAYDTGRTIRYKGLTMPEYKVAGY